MHTDADIARSQADGLTYREISEKYHISAATVAASLKRHRRHERDPWAEKPVIRGVAQIRQLLIDAGLESTVTTVLASNSHLRSNVVRAEDELEAASDHVRGAEQWADEWDPEFGPMWLGHGLHRAFLDGADWQRRRMENEHVTLTATEPDPGP